MRDDGAESAGPQTVNQGARFSLGRQLRNWVPQSFFGGKNGRAKGVSDAQAAGDEMAVDNPGTSAFPIRSLTDAHVPRLSLVPIRQSPAWLTFASLASRGGDLAPHHAGHAAPPHATAGHIQWATEGGPLPDSMSRHTGGTIAYSQSPTGKANEGPPSKESLDYMQLPALDRGIQDSVLSREHSPKTHFEIPRKVRWPCVSSRCPQAMRDASVPWSASRIRKLFQIGKGFMSEVFHAVDTASGLQVALKVYDKARMHRRDIDQVEEEVAIHIHLTHPNILGLFAAFADDSHLYIVLELASGDDLYKRMSRIPPSEQLVVRRFITPILAALEHCHSRGILHRDLKPENVLMTEDGTCKLCDFGFSINTALRRPVSRLGTLDFMAPEIVMAGRKHLDGVKDEVHNDADNYIAKADRPSYTSAIDVWAVGGLLYELLVRTTPFASSSKNRTMRKIVAGDVHIPESLTPHAADFIRQCLRPPPGERPSATRLLAHPLIAAHCPQIAQAAHERLSQNPVMALHVPWVADTQHRAVAPTATVPITAAAQTRRQSSDSYKMDAAAVTPPQHRFQTACSPTQQGAAVGTPQHMMQRQRTGSQALPALEIRSPGGSSGFNPNPAWGRAATRSIAPSEVLGEGSMCGGSAGPGVSFSPGMLTAPVSGHATEGSHYPIGVLGTPTKCPQHPWGDAARGGQITKRHSVESLRRPPPHLHPLNEDAADQSPFPGVALGTMPSLPVTGARARPIARNVKRRSQDVPSSGPIL